MGRATEGSGRNNPEALKACLTAGGLEQPSDDDSVDDPEAFAIKAKYESAKVDYEAAMKSALDEKSGFGDSEDEDAQWPPDASGFMGTETPQTSPKKPRKTTPPVARRPPKIRRPSSSRGGGPRTRSTSKFA